MTLRLNKETLRVLDGQNTSEIDGAAIKNTENLRCRFSNPPRCNSEECTVQVGTHCMPCQPDNSINDPGCQI